MSAPYEDEVLPKMECPKCHAVMDDMDGFGCLAHVAPMADACGYCTHPSLDGQEDGTWKCGICEATVTR